MEAITTTDTRGRAPRYQPLVLAVVSVAVGIVVDRYLSVVVPVWLAIGLSAWCAWFLTRRRSHVAVGTALLSAALAAVGGAWHHQHWNLFDEHEIGRYAGELPHPVCVEVVARGSPRHVSAPPHDPLAAIPRKDRSRFTARVTRVRDGDDWRPAAGAMQVWIDGVVADIERGDRLRIVGLLSAPAAPQNPGEFDFAAHCRADRQLSRLSADFAECLQLQERAGGWSIARIFDRMRRHGNEFLWRKIDARRAALASALLLGVQDELDDETNAAFAKTGTIHLLSISGLHVGILSMFLFGVLRLGFLGRRAALTGVALVTLTYALLIAAEPPAVRATIVVLLVCLAMSGRRRWQPSNLLAGAALVVLAMNPCDLFRIGPQLSFLAVMALTWAGVRFAPRPIVDPLDRLIAQTRPWHVKLTRRWCQRFGQATAVSFCVWIVTAPLVCWQFHLLSPATLLLTPLLAIPISAALISGFLSLAVGWLVPPLGSLCAIVCDGSLWAVGGCIDFAASLTVSHAWVPGPPLWWLFGFYAALAAAIAAPRFCPPRRWCAGCLAGWASIGFIVPIVGRTETPRLECTFLSVGHGCAVFLQLPGGERLLYDAGRLGSPAAGARSVSGYLWHRGITRLDAIVLSHADVDHYNAVPELLTKFRVGVIYATPAMLLDEGPAMRKLLAAIRAANVPLRETWSGDRLRVGGDCLLEVWHPARGGVLGSDNANSLVLDIEYQGRRILLTGDLETPGIDDLLSESPAHCDVILAPHHGSARSNPPGFAAWSTPDVAIVSGSFNDRRPEVEQAYRALGAQVLSTADCGAIEFTLGADGVRLSTWKQHTIPSPSGRSSSLLER